MILDKISGSNIDHEKMNNRCKNSKYKDIITSLKK